MFFCLVLKETEQAKGSHSVLLWGGEDDERMYSVIDCKTGIDQLPQTLCLGGRVACLAKVGDKYWLGTEVSSTEVSSYHISYPIPSYPLLSHAIPPYPLPSHATTSYPIPSYPLLSHAIPSYHLLSHHILFIPCYPIISSPIP